MVLPHVLHRTVRFECSKTSTNTRVDAAVIHDLVEAPLASSYARARSGARGRGIAVALHVELVVVLWAQVVLVVQHTGLEVAGLQPPRPSAVRVSTTTELPCLKYPNN